MRRLATARAPANPAPRHHLLLPRTKSTYALGRSGAPPPPPHSHGGSSGRKSVAKHRRQSSAAQPRPQLSQLSQQPLPEYARVAAAESAAAFAPLSSVHEQALRAAAPPGADAFAVGNSDPAQLRDTTYTGDSTCHIAEAVSHAHSAHEREMASKMHGKGGLAANAAALDPTAGSVEIDGDPSSVAAAPIPAQPRGDDAAQTEAAQPEGPAPQPDSRPFSLVGTTDLSAPDEPKLEDYPEIAQHWDFEANHEKRPWLSPASALADIGKVRLSWSCPVAPDHKWLASIPQRMKNPTCPCCDNRQLSESNSLAVVYPDIAAQFHPTLNLPDATLPAWHNPVRTPAASPLASI
jgi:hypothetical protein